MGVGGVERRLAFGIHRTHCLLSLERTLISLFAMTQIGSPSVSLKSACNIRLPANDQSGRCLAERNMDAALEAPRTYDQTTC